MLESLSCRICGGELQEDVGGTYKCVHCGHTFVKKAEDDYAEKLKDLLKEEKYEKVSAARQNLWAAMHEEYVNSSSCMEYARGLKSLVPSDYYANFAETANGKGEEEISRFLNKSSKGDMETYADAVLDFMIKSMTPGNLTAVCNYIDRSYPKASPEYAKYINLYEEEAEKVESGIYELTMPRDVFVAYSSKDIDKVLELTDCLEEQGISCFISMRNLRHGRGAADNYDKALQTAIDNCKTIVFISSRNSRSLACDALRKEIPYIRKTDTDNAPAEYRTVAYEKIPYRYKKDRVEYLLDDYANTAADKIVKQFFDGVEWCKTPEDVADRVITYLTAVPETDDAPRGGNIDDEDIQKIISAVSGADKTFPSEASGTAPSMAIKERNVVSQVQRLISMGAFPEAKSRIDDLEKEEQSVMGVCSATVYYYKILIDNESSNDEQLINKLVAKKFNPSDDKNFRLAKACDDSPDKTNIIRIEKKIVDTIEENERREREERRRKEEAERAERERREKEERERRERAEAARKAEKERIEAEKREKKRVDLEYENASAHWSKGNSLWSGRVLYRWTTRSVPVLFIECAIILLIACVVMERAESSAYHLASSQTTIWGAYPWLGVLAIINFAIASILSVVCFVMDGLRTRSALMYKILCIVSIVFMTVMLVGGVNVYCDTIRYFELRHSTGYPGPAPKCIISVTVVFIALAIGMLVVSIILHKKHSGYIKAEKYWNRNSHNPVGDIKDA